MSENMQCKSGNKIWELGSLFLQSTLSGSQHVHYDSSVFNRDIYLRCGQPIAYSEAINSDLDLALVDHVNDGLSSRVHGDDWH